MPEKNEKDENEEDVKEENRPNKTAKKKKTRKLKKSTIKKISAVVVLIALLIVVLYFAFRTLGPEKTIATVNGEAITKQELDQKYEQLPDQYKLFITKDAFLDQIINVRLLLQEAEKQSITVSEEELDFEIDSLKAQAPTEEAFEQLLQQQNLGLNDLKKQIKDQLKINKLLNKTVTSKIQVSDSKIKEYYKNNQDYFEENNITYNEAKEQIRQILINDLASNSIEIYINQLRSNAIITREGDAPAAEVKTEIETFTETEDPICKQEGKVIIRLFSTTKSSTSKWISQTFDGVANEYSDDVIAYHWELDTGDNALTDAEEQGIPKREVELFQKYNPKNTVPAYVFGCKYIRVGNAYGTLEEEKAEFERVIKKLI